MRRFVKDRKVPTKQQLIRALADKWYFADMIGFHGGNQAFGQIHKELLDWYDNDESLSKRDLILMPRAHLKTTVITVLDILHSIYVNPNIRIYVGSGNKALAKAIMREVTANLTNPWLQDNVWNNRPHIEGRLIPLMDKLAQKRRNYKREESLQFSEWDDSLLDENPEDGLVSDTIQEANKKIIWTQEAIQVLRQYDLKEPTLVAGSVESPATGFHYDKLYFDDIINFDNYDKPEKIERLDTWRNDMFSVLDDEYLDEDLLDWLNACSRNKAYRKVFKKLAHVGGDCTVVGTRYFRHDWYKQIIDDKETDYRIWVRNIYKNGSNNLDGYLWNERWDEKIENRKRRETSKKHFYAQYLNEVIVTEDQILPFDRIQFIHASQIRQKDGSNRISIDLKEGDTTRSVEVILHLVVDPAATCNKNSDFTACAVGGKDDKGVLYVVDVRLWRLPADKWIKEMYGLMDKWHLRAAHIETVAFFVTVKDTIKQYFQTFYPISLRDYKPGNQATKKERIETGLEPLLSNGMLYMTTWCASNNELVDQFNFFPAETVKDDGVDTVEMLNEICKPTRPNSKLLNNQVPFFNRKYGGIR